MGERSSDMGWLNILASAVGPGSAGTVLAAAVYGAGCAAEKAASPEALKDISKWLKKARVDGRWSTTCTLINRSFEFIFGNNHFTVKCALRSIITTLFMIFMFTIFISIKKREYPTEIWGFFFDKPNKFLIFIVIVFGAFIPDYISLWKGRLLLKKLSIANSFFAIFIITVCDIFFSIFIALIFYIICAIYLISATTACPMSIFDSMYCAIMDFDNVIRPFIEELKKLSYWEIYSEISISAGFTYVLFFSTLTTSFWTSVFTASSSLIRVITSIDYIIKFTVWYFPVDKNPVRALGGTIAAVLWVISIIYAFI